MKICMLAPALLPIRGGVANYIVELLQHLPRQVEVHVVTPSRIDKDNVEGITTQYEFENYFTQNVHIHFLSQAHDTFYYNAIFQAACFRYVPKLVKEEEIDLLHSHTAHMPDLLLMVRKIRKPIVTTVHSTIRSQFAGIKASKRLWHLERSEKATFLLYPLLRCAEAMYFKQKRIIITPSLWMKEQLERMYHYRNIQVIPNSVDMEKIESTQSHSTLKNLLPVDLRDKRGILFVGRLLELKGVDVLLRAIPRIVEETDNECVFIFAGPGQKRYLQKIRERKIEAHCIFLGPLSHDTILQIMKEVEVMVLPSFTENTPYTLLEAMACGIPIITTKVGGIPEMIQHRVNGLLIKPGLPKTLADAVISLLTDKQLQGVLIQNARETVRKKFSWAVNLNKLLKVYDDALQN